MPSISLEKVCLFINLQGISSPINMITPPLSSFLPRQYGCLKQAINYKL